MSKRSPIRVGLTARGLWPIAAIVPLWGIVDMQSHLGRMPRGGNHAIDELNSKERVRKPTRLPTLSWYPQIDPMRKYRRTGAGWVGGVGHRIMKRS